MDFNPSETQTMLNEMVTGLLEREYGFDIRRRAAGMWGRFAELGVLGAEIEERFGGTGGTFDDLAAILGPLGRSLVVEPFLPTIVLGAGLIAAHGSEVQKSTILPRVVEGTLKLALAHAERAARDDIKWVTARAERSAEGWHLSGAKAVALGADAADILVISARTAGQRNDASGVSLFLVPVHAAGLERRIYTLYDRSGAADLSFTNVFLAPDALLGEEGAGLPAIEIAYDRARAALCVEAIGAIERLREITLDYLRTRVQFGQPIGKFQALQHRMVDAHMEVELARSMSLLAITAVGDSNPAHRARCVSAAKARIGQAARTVGQTAVQLHGGIALTEEYSAGHYFKRLTMIERLFGDVGYHTRRFAGV